MQQGIIQGKSTNCDLTVGDIYGQDSEQFIKMNSNVLASSLGKVS
jgi:pantothenate kinase